MVSNENEVSSSSLEVGTFDCRNQAGRQLTKIFEETEVRRGLTMELLSVREDWLHDSLENRLRNVHLFS